MKGYRFYLEYPNKTEKNKATRKELGNHLGNVIALNTEASVWTGYNTANHEGFAGILDTPDSPVAYTNISHGYLSERCKYINEQAARQIHPELFRRLDE